MNERTDAELVALARAGDKDAFGQLVERYQSTAQRVAMGMVANEGIARQLVQEAMLQAYLSLAHLRDDGRFKSWLYGIVLNVCRSYIRDQKAVLFSWEAMVGGLRVDDGNAVHQVDARPSDAINLALHMGSPIYVTKKVLDRAAIDIPENVWERQQLGRGLADMAGESDRERQEWERRREEAKSRPRPTEEQIAQGREKHRQEMLDLVFGVEA